MAFEFSVAKFHDEIKLQLEDDVGNEKDEVLGENLVDDTQVLSDEPCWLNDILSKKKDILDLKRKLRDFFNHEDMCDVNSFSKTVYNFKILKTHFTNLVVAADLLYLDDKMKFL